eukprot:2240655-Rhodomonas_salina.2
MSGTEIARGVVPGGEKAAATTDEGREEEECGFLPLISRSSVRCMRCAVSAAPPALGGVRPSLCGVWYWCRCCYAMSGTDVGYGPTRQKQREKEEAEREKREKRRADKEERVDKPGDPSRSTLPVLGLAACGLRDARY